MVRANRLTTIRYRWQFTCFGVLALFIALMLKREDRIKGYGLELPNIQKDADKAEAEIIAKEMIAEP